MRSDDNTKRLFEEHIDELKIAVDEFFDLLFHFQISLDHRTRGFRHQAKSKEHQHPNAAKSLAKSVQVMESRVNVVLDEVLDKVQGLQERILEQWKFT